MPFISQISHLMKITGCEYSKYHQLLLHLVEQKQKRQNYFIYQPAEIQGSQYNQLRSQ